ncbi:MAG TPA: DNA translocase FtsK [Phycisphaerae bacterium]|nr:DNA translocase FtsK [Phycisphaerae bacterium]
MAARKNSNPNKAVISRVIFMMFVWVGYILFTLACISFNASDPPSHMVATFGAQSYHNWCGAVGAQIAYSTLQGIGPGIFVAIAFFAVALVLWTRGDAITQLPLRIIGCALLVAGVSTLSNMSGAPGPWGEGAGGMLGIAIGHFLFVEFRHGSWFILIATFVVGGLLAADEFMLALPARLLWVGKKLPTEPVAAAATGAATGIWGTICSSFEGWGSSKKMGKVSGRKKKDASEKGAESATANKNPAEASVSADEFEDRKSKIENPAEPAKVEAKPVAEESDEEEAPTAVAEVPVRKPTVPRTNQPIKPQPAQQKAQDLGNYRLPGLDLLDEAEPVDTAGQEQRVREKAKVLEAALESFNIDGKVEAIDTGPVVTLYELNLAPGVKSSQVAALSKDIARALKSPPVRIIDNIPGKSTMGIEVPNLDRERVRLKELFQLSDDKIVKMALPMCLGKDASGNPMIEDLARIPHVLIAGTTGSGKSVCINSIIMTLLLTQRPDHVKLIMVDPKMVEMQDYKAIPHLMAPIIDDMSKAESILEWATQKMDERYETMSEAGVRHIKDYNKLSREEIITRFNATTDDDKAKLQFHMPYIVIIIDELADLMMTSKEVEGHIVRIAQKARAVGIHLILATQRPEAQVVTGLIKSNMPGRICFQVRSRLDSRIMLDQSGGELLLGQGDMLMLRPTGGGLIRAQAAFVDDKEIRAVCGFLKEIAQPEFHPELLQLGAAQGLAEGEEKDPLYNDAVDIMIETGRGSVSLIQRRLNIGYSRASRLIDQMRRLGIVGAYKGSMASEVTISKEEWEQMKLEEKAAGGHVPGGDGTEGSTGGKAGAGGNAGFAQQVSSQFDENDDDDDGSVPDEMPGEHRY